jgi:putative transposase
LSIHVTFFLCQEVIEMPKDRYRRGSHTVLDLKYHFVWKTKYSYKVLRRDVGLRLRELIRQICAEKGISVVKGNVRANPIHLLVSAPAYLSPAKMAQFLKGRSSYRLQREFPVLRKRYWGQHLWGRGYFCSTVGAVTEQQIQEYIENQTDDEGSFEVWDEPNGEDEDDS